MTSNIERSLDPPGASENC